jgi:hypothetical protein
MSKVLLLFATSLLMACSEYQESKGFSLPEGDPESGQLVFIEYRCIECHTLAGTEFTDELEDFEREIMVRIGGETTRVKSYGDLVTSIINPSHRLAKGYAVEDVIDAEGESRMRNYNEELNVRELIDLVAFLKSKYKLKSVPQTMYPYYIYPG